MSWPIEAKNVKKIQIEISNYCNADVHSVQENKVLRKK